jgi:hypothetical protein
MNGGNFESIGPIGPPIKRSSQSPGINPNFGKRTQQLGAQEIGVNGVFYPTQPSSAKPSSPPRPTGKDPDFSHLSEEFGMRELGPSKRSTSTAKNPPRSLSPDHGAVSQGKGDNNTWKDPSQTTYTNLYEARTRHVAASATIGKSRWGQMETERAAFMADIKDSSPTNGGTTKPQPPKPRKRPSFPPQRRGLTSGISMPGEKPITDAHEVRGGHMKSKKPSSSGFSVFLPDQQKTNWLLRNDERHLYDNRGTQRTPSGPSSGSRSPDVSAWMSSLPTTRNSGLVMPGEKPVVEQHSVNHVATSSSPMNHRGWVDESSPSSSSAFKKDSTGEKPVP